MRRAENVRKIINDEKKSAISQNMENIFFSLLLMLDFLLRYEDCCAAVRVVKKLLTIWSFIYFSFIAFHSLCIKTVGHKSLGLKGSCHWRE
jgi:hypothetical protein